MSNSSATEQCENKPPTSRQIKAEQTKNKLLEIGGRLTRQKRLDTVSVRDITQLAGVSTGTFYLYFDSKDAFFLEVFHHYGSAIFDEIDAYEGEAALDSLFRFVDHFIENLSDMDVSFVQQWFAHFGDPEFYEPWGLPANPGEKHYVHTRNCIQRAIDEGELIPDTPAYDLANVISMLLSGLAAHVAMSSRGFDLEKRSKFLRRYIEENVVGPYRTETRPSLSRRAKPQMVTITTDITGLQSV